MKQKKQEVDKLKQWIVNLFCRGKHGLDEKKFVEFWTGVIKSLGLRKK